MGFNPCFNGTMYKNLTELGISIIPYNCFNPCFNGTMYKNLFGRASFYRVKIVSILVLMELCIKTRDIILNTAKLGQVSILVLMELCIKTIWTHRRVLFFSCFNPCFNGTMYKNSMSNHLGCIYMASFNPCFNGTMYKNNFFRTAG